MKKASILFIQAQVLAFDQFFIGEEQNTFAHKVMKYNEKREQSNSSFAQDEKKPEPWWENTYYTVPSFEMQGDKLIERQPSDIPKKVPGKKRILLMGDSLAIDDEDYGWTHHFAYKIAAEKMPFDVVNLAKSGSMIAKPAHIFLENSENNCYRLQLGSNTWFTRPSHHLEEEGGYKHRWELAATTGADYLVIQMGANDLFP